MLESEDGFCTIGQRSKLRRGTNEAAPKEKTGPDREMFWPRESEPIGDAFGLL